MQTEKASDRATAEKINLKENNKRWKKDEEKPKYVSRN